jgi:uroporphyrin-3 C-methyltransferase
VSTEQETTNSAAPAVEKPQPSSPDKPAKPVKAAKAENKASSAKGGGVLAGLALLLAMAALGGSGYLWYLQQNTPQQEPVAIDDLRPELTQLSAQVEAQVDTLKSELGAARQQIQTIKQQTSAEMEQLSRDSVAMLSQVTELGRTDRDDWQLAEVEYLLRLAHQRVVMGGELKSAASLLSNADNILHDLNMAGLHQVRKQVARDLSAVRAAVELDSEGIYLRLDALQQQSASLPFFGMPKIDAPPEEPVVADEAATEADDWQSTLEASWQQAVAKFKTLVVVQKQDGSVEPLLSEAWQLLVRERLALDLEQAKNAVVLQQQTIYREALSNASELVQSHYVPEHPATQSALTELEALQQEKIVMDLPDISGSQEAIRAYIDQKYQGQEQAAPLAEQEPADPPLEQEPADPEPADPEPADPPEQEQQADPSMEQEEAP